MFEFLRRRPKPRVMVMRQSDADDAAIYNLGAQDIALITGTMNGCCSVILLWGRTLDQKSYLSVRGQHGAGGPQALVWDRLLAGFPTDSSGLIIVACVKDDLVNYSKRVKTTVVTERRLGAKIINVASSDLMVNRSGISSNISSVDYTDPAKYDRVFA